MVMSKSPIFKVIFLQQSQVYELYARAIFQSELYGFIEVEELVFGERSQIIADPGEERLKSEFAGVKRTYLPMHAILRIDEVEKEGIAKVVEGKGEKVTPLPIPGWRPGEPRGP